MHHAGHVWIMEGVYEPWGVWTFLWLTALSLSQSFSKMQGLLLREIIQKQKKKSHAFVLT